MTDKSAPTNAALELLIDAAHQEAATHPHYERLEAALKTWVTEATQAYPAIALADTLTMIAFQAIFASEGPEGAANFLREQATRLSEVTASAPKRGN